MAKSGKALRNQEKVRSYLRSGQLRVGDRLPGERMLAESLEMGRASLRSVLDKLAEEGVLCRRPQSGTFLAAIPLPVGLEVPVTLIGPLTPTKQPARVSEPGWIFGVISAFERVTSPAGIHLTLLDQSPVADDPRGLLTLVQQAIAARTRAVILIHPLDNRARIAQALALLEEQRIEAVIVSSRDYAGLANRVYFDSSWGGYLATRHLLQRGHRRIGFAGAPPGHEWLRDRLAGYHHALEAAEIAPCREWEWFAEESERLCIPEDGAAALDFWLEQPRERQPTGVVAVNDIVALGLLAAARRKGIAIPGELSLVGFDNDPDTLLAGLSTVERPRDALGEAVARVLLERLTRGATAERLTVQVRPTLIERHTVGPPYQESAADG